MTSLSDISVADIVKCLERIANALESGNKDVVVPVLDTIHREDKDEGLEQLLPEERFIYHVKNLNKAFQEVVKSFSEGEAQRVDYMTNYPFDSFSVVQLSIAVNDWTNSLQVVDKVKEDEGRKKEELKKVEERIENEFLKKN